MKPNTIEEIQEVVNAYLDGKPIEMNSLSNREHEGWMPFEGGSKSFIFNVLAYRVMKPLTEMQRVAKALGMPKHSSVNAITNEIYTMRRQIENMRENARRHLD